MLAENLLVLIEEPLFNYLFNNIIATLAVMTYVITLYPGIWQELFSRKGIKVLFKYRQQIGIASCLFGCVHAIYSVQLSLLMNPHLPLWRNFHNYTSGITCLTIFLLLGLTSNSWMQKKLKKNWKRLHSLTYILPILLAWHILVKVTEWSVFTQLCFIMLISANSLIILRFSKRIFTW